MRIAILSDIHSNIVALNAVAADMSIRSLEGAIHLGDLVGHGPRPNEAVERIIELGIHGVVGNYDMGVLDPDAENGRALLKPGHSQALKDVFYWTRDKLGDKARKHLSELPAQIRLEEGDRTILLTHGSPERPTEYLYQDTPRARLDELFKGSGADILIVGHTHIPHITELGDNLFINPGSVGRPTDGDPRASYLIVDTESGFRAENIRVTFDVESVAVDCVSSGLPEEMARGIRLGISV